MRLFVTLAICALTLVAISGLARAEQIRLSDGRYLQGEVSEVKEDGFVFKLTDTGGKVFLRWSQVDAGLKKRLTNDKDPDEGLNLEVMVAGARLELIDGTIYEGNITQVSGGYKVVNRDFAKGKTIPDSEVVEEGFITDIMIDASSMMVESEVLKLAEDERSPLETARQFYEMARIADNLGLYLEAKDFVTLALAAGPDAKLEARLTAYDATLDELIRQKGLLTALAGARQLAKKKKFQTALDVLTNAKTEYKPTETVLAKWDLTYAEIDLQFTAFVVTEWYKQMRPVTRAKLKEKGLTISDCISWARREIDNMICAKIAELVGSTTADDMKKRFIQRFNLEAEGKLRLSMKKASFGETGFYQIVGGHLPINGKKPDPATPTPPGGRPGPGGSGSGPGSGRDGSVVPGEDIGDFLKKQGFQEGEKKGGELPGGIKPEDIRDFLKKIAGDESKSDGEKKDGGAPAIGKQDISHLKVPATVPTLQEWWDGASSTTKAKWLEAYYVRYAGTMRVFELDDWNVKFK